MSLASDTIILALDTTGGACSVAVWRGGAILGHLHRPMARGHAEALVPMVQEVLGLSAVGFEDVTAIGVAVGPGSFTGVRAGLAAARGFALARDLPLVGIDSFEAIAEAVPEPQRAGRALVVAIDTKRRDLYLQVFSSSCEPLDAPSVMRPEVAAEQLPSMSLAIAGDGRAMLLPVVRQDCLELELDAPDARCVATLAARKLAEESRGRAPLPLYLREPEAVVPKLGGRLRP